MGHSSLLDSVAARLPEQYRDAYLEGIARVHADRRGSWAEDAPEGAAEAEVSAA